MLREGTVSPGGFYARFPGLQRGGEPCAAILCSARAPRTRRAFGSKISVPRDPFKEAGHGTERSSEGGVGKVGAGCWKWASRPPRVLARRRRVRRGGDGLHGRSIRRGGAAQGRPVEPRAGRDLSVLRAAVAVRGKGRAHALQSERRDPHFARAHAASPHQRYVHAERPAFHDRALRHPGHRPGQAPPGDPRPGEAAPRLHARRPCALPDGVAHDLRRMRRQQRADVLQGTDPGKRAGAARSRVLRRMDRCSALLEETGIDPKAKWLVAEGADSLALSRSVPLTKALDDAMIALYQNGERLMPGNGYPMRLLLPGWEGNMNVKFLRRLKLVEAPAMSYYETRTYSQILPGGKAYRFYFLQEVKSFITHPSPGLALKGHGLYEISGVAYSGNDRISKVMVSADGGNSWGQAALQAPVLSKAFTRFRIPWRWDGGPAVLQSRAWDEAGNVQPTRAQFVAARGETQKVPNVLGFPNQHYNSVTSWAIDGNGEVKHVYA